jgi:hypothetical protein
MYLSLFQIGRRSRNTGVAIELLMPVDPNWFTVAGGVIIVAIMVFEAWTFAGTRRWIDSLSTRARVLTIAIVAVSQAV